MSDTDIAKLFIISRKYNLKRAVQLFKDHVAMRNEEDLNKINPLDIGIHCELVSGKFTVMPPMQDNSRVALFTEGNRAHSWRNYKDSIKSLIFQLDVAIRDESLQQNGLIILYNMSEASYNRFDFDLCTRVLKLLKGKYPARLKCVLILSAPIWFRAPYNVLKLFVSEKMRKRIFFVNATSLRDHVPEEIIQVILGGKYPIYHELWLRHCFKVQNIENKITDSYFNTCIPQTKSNPWKCHLTRRTSLQSGSEFRSISPILESKRWYTSISSHNSKESILDKRRISNPQSNLNLKREDIILQAKEDKSNVNIYSAFQPSLPGMSLNEFKDFMYSLSSYELLGRQYLLEFSCYSEDQNNHFEFSLPQNKVKNRYLDVVCLDHNRVNLPDKTYIHANFVDSYLQRNAYICCQGPLEATIRDFYYMILHIKIPIVVMTTRECEGQTKKCARYLPTSENGTSIYGEFQVLTKDVKSIDSYKVSNIEIIETKTNSKHTFIHYHFLNWPDFGIPESPKEFIGFIEIVHDRYNKIINELYDYESELETYYIPEGKSPPPPILVHCSAGVGRTGTFVTIAINQKRAKYEGKLNIKDTLKIVRTQRSGSIQMPQQYIFCFIALLFYVEKLCS